MRNLVVSIALAASLAVVGSGPSRACQTVKESGPCLAVAAESRPAVPSQRVASLELNLPAIETLTANSDYTLFLKPDVPEELQRLALRKLWLSDLVFAYRDGLDTYDYDYKGYPDDQGGLNSFARADEQ